MDNNKVERLAADVYDNIIIPIIRYALSMGTRTSPPPDVRRHKFSVGWKNHKTLDDNDEIIKLITYNSHYYDVVNDRHRLDDIFMIVIIIIGNVM